MAQRAGLSLLLVFLTGTIVFLLPGYLRIISEKKLPVLKEVRLSADGLAGKICENVFLLDWEPDVKEIQGISFPGFEITEVHVAGKEAVIEINRKTASFVIRLDDGHSFLSTEEGDFFWEISSFQRRSFEELPVIFNCDSKKSIEIIGSLKEIPVRFRNFISDIDSLKKVVYFRGGNILLVESWKDLEKLNFEDFLGNLGQKETYELFSNGLYFPVEKRGD